MVGYFNRPKETAEAFTADGWLKTGDVAHLEADSSLRFVGRLSERYKSGGYNINPREIELAIEEHPSVALAAVVGVPDALYQEVGCAFIVAKAGNALADGELRDWCRAHMANYKVPKHFYACAELPLLPIGKVDKRALKTMHVNAQI
jgi:acyl-CoA synthetase (AMP-forming)/AMP-acid ligase II